MNWRLAVSLVVAMTMPIGTASAKVLVAQTGSETSTSNGGSASDVDWGSQRADDVTLGATAIVRSAKWWGMYGPFENTPVMPLSFQLVFYRDSGGLPDTTNVLGSTSVQFTNLAPAVELILGDPVYEFRANIPPTLIPAGARVWFSVLADTANDPDDDFLLREDNLGDSARRSAFSNAFASAIGTRMLFVLYDGPVRPVTTIYADDFSGATGLAGAAPDERPGAETWIASPDWQANGTTASVDSTGEDDSAFLPFTPLPGKIYTLSATLKQPTGGYSSSSANAWAGIGFAASNSVGAFATSPNNSSPWMFLRRTGDTRSFTGPGTAGGVNELTVTGARILRIVLDTTAPNWTAEWFVGLLSLRKHTFTTHPTIRYVGIAREDGVAADFDTFMLTAENGDVAPRIVSFSSAGGDAWNLELYANPGMPYEFRSSTNLVFTPGTLVENLSKGQPSDPGTVGGSNDSEVTTDDKGNARVRMTLTGTPLDFVQTVSLP